MSGVALEDAKCKGFSFHLCLESRIYQYFRGLAALRELKSAGLLLGFSVGAAVGMAVTPG